MAEPETGTCPRCGGRMEKGFCGASIADLTTPVYWVEGALERERLTRGAASKGRARYSVVASRCGKCGFLEFFASGE